MKFQLIILILVSFFNCLLQAATVTITTRTGYDQTSKPPREILYITILEDGKPLQNGNILVDPVSTNPANYQAILTSGGKATAVEVESVKATDKPYTSNFLLFPKSKLESGGTYHVSINKDTWRMRDGSNYNGPASSTETKEDANKFNQDYLARSYYFEKSIKLETGDPGGTIAINWNFTTGSDPYNSPLNEGDWHFAFDGKAGFALKDDERFGFSNSLNSEISGFYRTPWPENPNAAFRFFGDTGFEAEITSDQVFDNAEVASGLFATMIIGNPITDYLSSHVVFGGGLTAALSPIIKLKYQGVATIADNQDRAVELRD